MRYLLSLPTNAASNFQELNGKTDNEWFCTSDPKDKRVGSGGGSVWLLEQSHKSEAPDTDFDEWLPQDKRILIHAGGQSRRLPAYAVAGKAGIPVPVFRWARGQKISQDLLSLQLPLYKNILSQSSPSLNTLIASGDVYIRTEEALPRVGEADVVCYGLWVDSSLATRHGVFASKRETPETLDKVMQKPSLEQLESLSQTHFFLMDIGIWLLSDKAVRLLRERSYNKDGELSFYDLYSDFGLSLGENPQQNDKEINQLSVKVVPLQGGEFYHFGSSREIISSSLAIQNKVHDQRLIMHRKIKPNNSIFTQNAEVGIRFTENNHNIWIENSYVPESWYVSSNNIITGIPQNDWDIHLPEGVCVDIAHVGTDKYVVRPYGISDSFSGSINAPNTMWLGRELQQWLSERGLSLTDISDSDVDIQFAKLFPETDNLQEAGELLKWMTDSNHKSDGEGHPCNYARVTSKH
mgnify:CR=1 FL=1